MRTLVPRRTSTTVTASLLALPFLVGIAVLALAPLRVEQRAPGLVHNVLAWMDGTFGKPWGTLGPVDVLANILVFIPIGILAYLIIPRRAWIAALLVGPLMSLAIEGVQAAFLPERVSSVTDVAAASIGSTIGVAIAAVFTLLASLGGAASAAAPTSPSGAGVA